MQRLPRWTCVLLCLIVLSGCALPRGAGLEREVLAVSAVEDGVPPDFTVEPVTRAALARYQSWPAVNARQMRWINRQAQPSGHIIAPGDTVSVTVWNTEDNSLLTTPGQRFVALTSISVSPGGTIFLPYLGNLRIAGMSPDRARETIENRFVEVTPSAQVQLEVEPGLQSTVSVVGGVGSPGAYPLPGRDYTILSLIAAAGGVSPGLNNPQIRLIRNNDIFGTAVARLFETPALDTTLVGGDRVLVEADDRYFLSLGAAGSEAMHPFTKEVVTALDALAIIGGVNDGRANPKAILILREYPLSALRADGTGPAQSRTVFTLDLTTADGLFSAGRFHINSGDLVYVTESPLPAAQSIFGLVGGLFGLAGQAGNLGD